MIDELVSKVVICIPSRSFHIFSDGGDELTVECETPDQFQRVFDLCMLNSERTKIEFNY